MLGVMSAVIDPTLRPTVLLDCDPGHDDAIAIMVAARHTDLVGITTVAGNAPLSSTTHNALVMRDLLGIDIAVHSGASRPLVGEPKHAGHVLAKAVSTALTSPPRPHPSTAPMPCSSSSMPAIDTTTCGLSRSAL
jgi:inosine-uridine nucleoside N-ribohydrolase